MPPTGWLSRNAETRFIEEEEAGGSTVNCDCRQHDWLGVSNVNFSTNPRLRRAGRSGDLIDSAGQKIGKLQDVYVDVETDEPMFGMVKEGFIGRHLTFVPLGGITIGPDICRSPHRRSKVKGAPTIELQGDELSQTDEKSLFCYYELNYTPPTTESGRRLARRA